jgi:hypothetical protein
MLEGYPVGPDDLAEDAFLLVAARLPKRQCSADAVDFPVAIRQAPCPTEPRGTASATRRQSEIEVNLRMGASGQSDCSG